MDTAIATENGAMDGYIVVGEGYRLARFSILTLVGNVYRLVHSPNVLFKQPPSSVVPSMVNIVTDNGLDGKPAQSMAVKAGYIGGPLTQFMVPGNSH